MSTKKGGDRKLTHKEKASIKFTEAVDPPFMREIKAKLGYKEPCTVNDKFADKFKEDEDDGLEDRDDIRNMKEEERPQIVVLNEKTDVSREQLDKEVKQHQEVEDKKKIEEGRITFKKPEKRASEDSKGTEVDIKKIKSDSITMKKLQSSKLLSFGDGEDEEG